MNCLKPYSLDNKSREYYSKGAEIPIVFLNMFSIAAHFYPQCFGKCCPPFTYIAGPKRRNSICQNRTLYFGEHHP